MSSTVCTLFGLSLLAVLLAGYLGQKYLPPPTPKIVGIDLGTTYSCIGVYHAVIGGASVLENDDGHQCIPSIVALTDNGDSIIVGHKALAQADKNPLATIYDAKRFIGKKMAQGEFQTEMLRYPFKMTLDNEEMVTFDVNTKKLTPTEIGGYILKTLKQTAERNLSIPVTRAVISVPAEFSARQRNETRRAASLAGIDILRVINEPTAAALAYGLHKKEGLDNVMVVDLGGGTLDVSLMRVQGGMFQTIAMAGNSHLGGQDFTHKLMRHLATEVENSSAQTLTSREDIQTLRFASESAKLQLTDHDSAQIDILFHSFGDALGRWQHTITRQTFEDINADLFKKVLEPIKQIFQAIDIERSDVDEIVLVGGSTRVPKVRELLREYFGKDLNTAIDPELAVTIGVSLQAGILAGMWPLTVSAIEIPTTVSKMHLH